MINAVAVTGRAVTTTGAPGGVCDSVLFDIVIRLWKTFVRMDRTWTSNLTFNESKRIAYNPHTASWTSMSSSSTIYRLVDARLLVFFFLFFIFSTFWGWWFYPARSGSTDTHQKSVKDKSMATKKKEKHCVTKQEDGVPIWRRSHTNVKQIVSNFFPFRSIITDNKLMTGNLLYANTLAQPKTHGLAHARTHTPMAEQNVKERK